MNTLIIYSSTYGCAADCAKKLKTKLRGNASLIDIKENPYISLDNYDTVVIGGSIYVGKVSKLLQNYCVNNVDNLSKKRLGIFICCAYPKEIDRYFVDNFPDTLINQAIVKQSFGGEARMENMRVLHKMIVKAVFKGNYEDFKISESVIDEFAKKLNGINKI